MPPVRGGPAAVRPKDNAAAQQAHAAGRQLRDGDEGLALEHRVFQRKGQRAAEEEEEHHAHEELEARLRGIPPPPAAHRVREVGRRTRAAAQERRPGLRVLGLLHAAGS